MLAIHSVLKSIIQINLNFQKKSSLRVMRLLHNYHYYIVKIQSSNIKLPFMEVCLNPEKMSDSLKPP